MGRSVYTPSETEVAIYASFDSEDEYEWNDAIDVLVEQLEAAYPSVGSDSGWIGREARVVASSRLLGFAWRTTWALSLPLALVMWWVFLKLLKVHFGHGWLI